MFAIETTAMKDMKQISAQGGNLLDLSKNLGDLIRKAEDIASKSGAKEVRVDSYIVKISGGIHGDVECSICQHKTNHSKLYTVSAASGQNFIVYGHMIHQIAEHHYYGQGCHRLDPQRVVQIMA